MKKREKIGILEFNLTPVDSHSSTLIKKEMKAIFLEIEEVAPGQEYFSEVSSIKLDNDLLWIMSHTLIGKLQTAGDEEMIEFGSDKVGEHWFRFATKVGPLRKMINAHPYFSDRRKSNLGLLDIGGIAKEILQKTLSKNPALENSNDDSQNKAAMEFTDKAKEFIKKKDWVKAIETYGFGIDASPSDTTMYINRGFAFSRLNLFREAVQDYSKAIDLNTIYDDSAHYGRALASARLGHLDNGWADIEVADKLGEEKATSLLRLLKIKQQLQINSMLGESAIQLLDSLQNLDSLISWIRLLGYDESSIELVSSSNAQIGDDVLVNCSSELALPHLYLFVALISEFYSEQPVKLVISYYDWNSSMPHYLHGLIVTTELHKRAEYQSRLIDGSEILNQFDLFRNKIVENKKHREQFLKDNGIALPPMNHVDLAKIIQKIEPIEYPE